jgi:rhomboid protease GluP
LPAGIYTLDQVNRLRAALGMPEQTADVAGEKLDDFQVSVQSHPPLVTTSLIVACVVVFLAQAYHDRSLSLWGGNTESLKAWGANYGPFTLGGQWWRLVTHLFLHIGVIHILMNMWGLWIIGQLLERLAGSMAMALIYLFSGIAGGMASVAFHPHVPSAGASGAIFGLVGALFGLLLHARDVLPPARLRQLRSGIIAIVILNIFFGLSVPEIDNAAHAGGAIAGLLAGLIILPARSAGHWLRIGILAVVGTGAVLLAARFLPPPPKQERQILRQFAELMKKHTEGNLSNLDFADQLEAKVIVPWRQLAKETSRAVKGRVDATRQAKIEQYMRLWQESFDDLLAWAREGDLERRNQAMEKEEAAEKIVQELNAEEEKEEKR